MDKRGNFFNKMTSFSSETSSTSQPNGPNVDRKRKSLRLCDEEPSLKKSFNESSGLSTSLNSSHGNERSFANDRLKTYRASLNEKKGEITKVHTILPSATSDSSHKSYKRNHQINKAIVDVSVPTENTTSRKILKGVRNKNSNISKQVDNFKSKQVDHIKSKQVHKTGLTSPKTEREPRKKVPKLEDFNKIASDLQDLLDKTPTPKSKLLAGPESTKIWTSTPVELSTDAKSFSFTDAFNFWNKSEESKKNASNVSFGTSRNESCLTKSSLDLESMDWEGGDEQQTSPSAKSTDQQAPNSNTIENSEGISTNNKSKTVLVVVDTNVIIHHFDLFRKLLKFPRNGLVAFIPYQVLRELDFIKDGRKDKEHQKCAILAIKYIQDKLSSKDKRLQGESVEDVFDRNISTTGGDESILACCIELKKTRGDVILLSEDKNLRNKALVSNLKTCSSDTIINLLLSLPQVEITENPIIEEIRTEFSFLCSFIISKRLKCEYGDTWQRKITAEAPWTTKQCLRIFLKFWNAISQVSSTLNFNELGLPKQCRKTISDFLEFLEANTKIEDSDFKQFKEYCLNICLYLKEGFPAFNSNIKSAADNIRAKSIKILGS